MSSDPDRNPLYSREESPFTTALLDFFEQQAEARSKVLSVSVNENTKDMTIEGKEAANIIRVLAGALQQGARYVSLDTGKDGQPVRSETMQFFADKVEAGQHSYMKRAADQEYLQVLPVAALQQQLQQSIALQQHTKQAGQELTNITIDTGRLLTQERVRQEIFTREISRELREQGIKPDIKQLTENIRDDKYRFEIAGICREQGLEKPYVITIEQNESRAFLIRKAEARQTEQRMKDYMPGNVLEGTLRKEDALELKKTLQEEWEKGYRFVSFPADKSELKKEDFIFFRSAFSALEHAYENTTDQERNIVRTISILAKEVGNRLENKMELQPPPKKEGEELQVRSQEGLHFLTLKDKVMNEQVNEKNFEFLSNQLKYTGFGESLQPALREALQKGDKEFALGYQPEFSKEAVATLQFKRSDTTDMVFYNRFNVAVKNDKHPDGLQQGFNVQTKGDNFTLKEAFNLLEGRPVLKMMEDRQQQKYEAWVTLNLKEQKANGDFKLNLYNRNYGFDLEKVLAHYPLKELQTPSYKESLMKSLQRGNLQSVTFQAGGKEEKLYISPDLKLGALKVIDLDQKRIPLEKLIEKQFIRPEFADRLQQQIAGFKQRQEPFKQELPKQEAEKQKINGIARKERVEPETIKAPKEKLESAPRRRQRNKLQ